MSAAILAAAAVLSFFLSGMEAAVTAHSRLRLRRWVREGRRSARVLLGYLDRPENFLWTVLVGNTLANLTVVWLAVTALEQWRSDSPAAFWTAFVGCVIALYTVCELLPKQLFRLFPNRLSLGLLLPFRAAHFALSPLVALVERFTAALLRLTGGRAFGGRMFADREELRAFMAESETALHPTERAWIGRVMDLQHRTLASVARPLDASSTVEAHAPVANILAQCRSTGLTRYPVWGGQGPTRRVIGVLSVKSLIYSEPNPRRRTAEDHMRPAMFLDESLRLESALERLQRAGEHLAIVVDASRRERGLVTLADLLGTIFVAAES